MFLFVLSCKKENPCPQLSLTSGNISNQEEYLIVESVLCDYTNDCSDFIQLSQESLSCCDDALSSRLERFSVYLDSLLLPSIPLEPYETLNDSSFIWGRLFAVQPNLISREELSCYFGKNFESHEDLDNSWNNYYDNFKDSRGYLKLGRPLIIGDEAFIEYAHFCGSLCGYGHFAILRKMNGKWVVKKTILTWIS